MDPVLDVDWVAHWRHLVGSRAAQKGDRQEGYWERRAPSYGAWRRAQQLFAGTGG